MESSLIYIQDLFHIDNICINIATFKNLNKYFNIIMNLLLSSNENMKVKIIYFVEIGNYLILLSLDINIFF